MATKVLYIGGSGRSGSTFLSMLLSQNDDMFDVGQIRDLPKSMQRNSACTCKSKLRACEYWSQVVGKLSFAKPLVNLAEGYSAFRKDVLEHRNWGNAKLQKRLRADHKTYLSQLSELYSVASSVAGDKALVDSSKSPELAFAAALCEDVSLYMLNLVRDPRAVVVSWAKRKGDVEGIEDFIRARAREWRTRQNLLSKFKNIAPEHYLLMRYEDLTATPRSSIAQVLEWMGQDAQTAFFHSDERASVSWDNLHLCPPINEGVLKRRETEITIRAADSWQDPSNKQALDITGEVAFPAAEKWGYSL